MKKIMLAVLLLSVIVCNAQNFEGVITWKITSDITDPKVKAQMEEAEKKMNDPETQAQMKEMQEKMNDPEMKKMMDANPQMKAQMEAAMKMMQGGGGLSSMMPKGFIIKMKNQNVLTSMDGGMMANMETLYLNEKKTSYQINREAKTYTVLPQTTKESLKDTEKVELKVTKTSETTKVLGYTCTKYIVESKVQGHSMLQNFWTTTAIKDLDLKSLANHKMGSGQQTMFYDQVEGVPLKMEIMMPQGKMVMEVTELKKQSMSSADFVLPAGYKEVPLKY